MNQSNDKLDLIFPTDLIPPEHQEALGGDCVIRPLARDDYSRGHIDVLSVLTVVPDPGEAAWQRRFDEMKSTKDTYYPIVITTKEHDRIIACGSVVMEKKFIRNLGTVAHIEDIVVTRAAQGKSLGRRVIEALVGIAEKSGAYKVILDCNKDNIVFYEKCGFKQKEVEMALYLNKRSPSK